MIQENYGTRVATLGAIGYAPGGGTVASLCMLPLIFSINYFCISLALQAVFILLFIIISFFIIKRALPFFESADPSEIVLDECVGMFIAAYALPFSLFSLIMTFFLFRLLDISKFFGITLFEKLPGAWGILVDDIVAACVANVIMHFVVPLACW